MKYLIYIFIFLSFSELYAGTRYFRGSTIASNNKWSNYKCWTKTSAGIYGSDNWYLTNSINNDFDTVYIDNLSFPGGASANTISLDAAINSCHTIIFMPSVINGADLIGNTLELFGNLTLQPNIGQTLVGALNFSSSRRQLSVNSINFKPNVSTFPATTYSFVTAGVTIGSLVNFSTESNYDIIGNFTQPTGLMTAHEYDRQQTDSYLSIDIGNGTIKNRSIDTIRVAGFYQLSGKFISNGHFISRGSPSDGYNALQVSQTSLAYPLSVSTADFNGSTDFLGRYFVVNNNAIVTINSAPSVTHKWWAAGIFNNAKLLLKNATIKFPYSSYLVTSGGDVLAGNSIVYFGTKLSSISYLSINDTLNEAHVQGTGRLETINTLFFKKLIIEDSAQLYTNINNKNNILDNGVFEMKPGSKFKSANGYWPPSGAATTGYPQISFGVNTKFIANGTCNKKIDIDAGEILMNASTTFTFNQLQITSNRIVGAGAPYNAGAGSSVLGISYGWVPTANPGTTFYWQYPLSTTSLVVTDTATYGSWHTLTNWSNSAGASPATPLAAATCLPSRHDSVVFPNGSYVNIKELYAVCKSMTWLGTGVLAGVSDTTSLQEIPVKNLDIYGSLTFSGAMQNKFYGDVNFKAWQSYPKITSSNKVFNRKINFIGTASSTGQVLSKWTLQDSITAIRNLHPEYIANGYGGDKAINVKLISGDLNTNSQNMSFNSFYLTYIWDKDSITLNLTNSKVFIVGEPYLSNTTKYPMYISYGYLSGGRVRVNPGSSQIIFKSRNGLFSGTGGQTRLYIYGGSQSLYDVSFMDNDLNSSVYEAVYAGTNNFHNMDFYYNGKINHSYDNNVFSKIHRLRTNINNSTTTTPFVINYNYAFQTNTKLYIDSAIYYGNATIKLPVLYNNVMKLSPGKIYNIESSPINAIQSFSLSTSILNAVGTCVNPITINGGTFSSTVAAQNATYLLLNNNTAIGTFSYANSVLNSTIGWSGTPDLGRNLHWKDITPGNSTGQWSDPNRWEILNNANVVIVAAPNCPPTPLDTVIFDNASFTGISDTVDASLGSSIASCHTMKWKNTSGNAIFKSAITDNVHIYGSLYFGKNMTNKHLGDFTFRGSSVSDSIRSNGKTFNRQMIFKADAPNLKHWHIVDSVYANYIPSVNLPFTYINCALYAGSLNTHGNKCTFGTFFSNTNAHRELLLDTSTIVLTGSSSYPYGPYLYYNVKSFNILDDSIRVKADKSTIRLVKDLINTGASGFMGGGHKWNKIISENNGDFYYWGNYTGVAKDTIYHLDLKNAGQTFLLKGAIIHKLTQGPGYNIRLGYGYTGLDAVSRIDSFISKRNVIISDSNHFVNKYHFEPGTTHTYPGNKVQYFGNKCELSAVGTASSNVFIYSDVAGQKAYWRKDSGIVCTDYCILQDNYAVGNGANYTSPSPLRSNVLVDTILNSSLYDGPTLLPTGTINPPLSGRAKFLAGSSAINNSNTSKGWDFSPYVGVPLASLTLSKDTICPGDSSLATITIASTIAKVFPIIVYYHNEFGNRVQKIFSVSGSSPYSWWAKPTTGSTVLTLDTIIIEQCFNSVLQLTDSKRLTVADPPILVTPVYSPNDSVCVGTPISLGATSFSTTTGGLATSYTIYSPLLNSIGNTNYSFTAIKDTVYWVEAVNYKGCKSAKVSLNLKVFNLPTVSAISTNSVSCWGATTGSINLTATGGTPNYTVNWTGSSSYTNITTGVTNNIVVGAGTYSALIVDIRGCKTNATAIITQPSSSLSISSISSSSIACFGITTGSAQVNVTGGTAGYTYSWSPASTSIINSALGLGAGSYTATIIDFNGCSKNQVFVINQPPSAITSTLLGSSNVLCFGSSTGSATVTVSGGTGIPSYTWIPMGGSIGTGNALSIGNYTVNITDANGCPTSKTVSISQPTTALSITSLATNSVLCFGTITGSINLTATGGTPSYTVNWSGPSSYASSTTGTISSITVGAGNYSAIIIDANGCTTNTTVLVSGPSAGISVALTGSVSPTNCTSNTGVANVFASGGTGTGYVYTWINSAGTMSTSMSTNTMLPFGTTTVTIVDANACTSNIFTFNVLSAGAPTVAVSITTVICNGGVGSASVNVTGISPFNYTWGSSTSVTNNSGSLVAGIYTVLVYETTTGCQTITTYTINEPSPLVTSVSNVINVNCFGGSTGSAAVLVSGGTPLYSYNWLPTGGATNTGLGLTQGNYTVTVTDANNCFKTNTVQILGVSVDLDVAITDIVKPSCGNIANGLITVDATGGTPNYSYLWSNGVSLPTNANISNGSYTVTVTDAKNCSKQLEINFDCFTALFIPEIFSPNGDGKNDKFEIKGILSFPNNNLKIFNRWGGLVYQKDHYSNDWDGKPNVATGTGKDILPIGVYFVVFDFGDNKTKTYHGFVQLQY